MAVSPTWFPTLLSTSHGSAETAAWLWPLTLLCLLSCALCTVQFDPRALLVTLNFPAVIMGVNLWQKCPDTSGMSSVRSPNAAPSSRSQRAWPADIWILSTLVEHPQQEQQCLFLNIIFFVWLHNVSLRWCATAITWRVTTTFICCSILIAARARWKNPKGQ